MLIVESSSVRAIMEDEYPSLPSNYVSLVQLQERWLREQQRKQREKEEQERKREEDQPKQSQNGNGVKDSANSASVNRKQFRRNRRNQATRDRQTVESIKPNLEESKIEAVVSQDEQKKDELKARDKGKRNRHRKPRVDENLAGGKLQLAPVEKPQVVVTEANGESEEIRSKFRRNGGDQGASRKVWEPKAPVDQTATLERNLEELSLNDGGGKERVRLTADMNAGCRKYNSGSERVDRRKLGKQRDCNLVWVKKEEITGTDITGIQSSGTSVKAGVDKKKRTGHSKQKYRTGRD